MFLILFIAVLFLAYANGANDNFKGVATLYGSKTLGYRGALWWATLTTFAGSLCSIWFASTLVKNFSGKGLVPAELAASPEFLIAVAGGAALTVICATLTGFPISTTHALIGGLIGSGIVAVGGGVNFTALGGSFFLPLLISPIVAVILSALFYYGMSSLRKRLNLSKNSTLIINSPTASTAIPVRVESNNIFKNSVDYSLPANGYQVAGYTGSIRGIPIQGLLDKLHIFSGGLVGFARGLNDTAKIVGLLLAVKALDIQHGMAAVALAIAVGGLLNARKVALKISHKITTLNPGPGFSASLVTGFLVIIASRLGMPVSTTHVSIGSIFGIGLINKKASKKQVTGILLSWGLTLPAGILFSAGIYFILV